MKPRAFPLRSTLFVLLALIPAPLRGEAVRWDADSPAVLARKMVREADLRGGLIVHVGCGEGRLTAAFAGEEGRTVHALDTDPVDVEAARRRLRSARVYGRAAADRWDGRSLPYVENLVNLLIVQDAPGPSEEEMLRVLAPRGVAFVRRDGSWKKLVKPPREDTDEWTHFLYDATNNAVSSDTVVEPPRRLRWTGSPKWARHHDHMASLSSMVSAGGRVFYIMDEGSKLSISLPPRWKLTARDAQNGTILWQRELPEWWRHLWPNKSGPLSLTRRLVATEDRAYVIPGLDAPVSALDARTGETLHTFRGTAPAEEFILSDGVLFVVCGESLLERDEHLDTYNDVVELEAFGRTATWQDAERRVIAVDAVTGHVLWSIDTPIAPLTLAADADGVYLYDGRCVVCRRRADGRERWRSEPTPHDDEMRTCMSPTLVVQDGVVLFHGGTKEMAALSAETGEALWSSDHPGYGYCTAGDIFAIGGKVWTDDLVSSRRPGTLVARALRTGEVLQKFPCDADIDFFHHRCYRNKATERYLLMGRTGVEFIDPRTEHWMVHHWVRGGCIYGIMPANGLLYSTPHPCVCFAESKLTGFCALAPEKEAGRETPNTSPSLVRGPAYGEVRQETARPADWPTYRHDPARSGTTPGAVPAEPARQWTAEPGGRLTAPTLAAGRLYVASTDEHTVHALDAETGEELWHFTAGGRVDSPPTLWRGHVLFGCADGHVYCLRAADGELVWKFRAAPRDRRLPSYGQIESVWPVHGSVLVLEGPEQGVDRPVLCCVAGRSMFLDGGLRFLKLDPKTGRKLAERVLDARDPDTRGNLQDKVSRCNMPTALPDILSSDGRHIYMRAQVFDMNGRRLDVRVKNAKEQQGEDAHLFSPLGFLDDTWFHRPFWLYGRWYLAGGGLHGFSGRFAPAGRIMSVGESRIYSFGAEPRYYRWTTPMEYQLYATDRAPEIVTEQIPPRRICDKMGWRSVTEMPHPAYRWTEKLPLLVRAMVLAQDRLFVAGPPDLVNEEEALRNLRDEDTQAHLSAQDAAWRGRKGGLLWTVSAETGQALASCELESPPVFDGMCAGEGRLYLSTMSGTVECWGRRAP